MKLAKVHQGVIAHHFEGEPSQIVYKTYDEFSIVPFPDWAFEFRENNIRVGYSRTHLVWDYYAKKFTEFRPMPNYKETMVTTMYMLRETRNKVLAATDYLVTVTDLNLTQQQKQQLTTYRQALRDITTDEYLSDHTIIEEYFLANEETIKFVHEFFPPCPDFISSIVEPILAEKITITREKVNELLAALEN